MFSQRRLLASALSIALLTCSPTAWGQLTFNFVDSTGAPASSSLNPQAVQGFQEAGQLWSSFFDDNITVNIEVDFAAIPGNVLGSTNTNQVSPTFDVLKNSLALDQTSANDAIAVANLPQGNTIPGTTLQAISFLTNERNGNVVLDNDALPGVTGANSAINNFQSSIATANAKAIGLVPANASGIDASISFNSNVNFDFDRSDGITAGTFDFVGVAAHELGHALGFFSGVDVVDSFTGAGTNATFDVNGGAPGIGNLDGFNLFSTADLFRRSADAFALDPDALDLSTNSTGDVFFSIDGVLGDGNDIPLETGSFNGTGNQASHFLDNQSLGILDPTVAASQLLVISQNDLLALDVIGFDLIPVTVPEPASGLALVTLAAFFATRRRRVVV